MKTHDVVERILKNDIAARSSDKELMIDYLQAMGAHLSDTQKDIIRRGSSLETLTRVRRKIQENGRYPASKKIAKERDFKSMQIQQITPKATPKYIADTLEAKQMGMF